MHASKNFFSKVFLSDRPKLLVCHDTLEDFIVAFHTLNE